MTQVATDAAAPKPAATLTMPWPRVAAGAALFGTTMGAAALLALSFLRSGLPTPPLLAPYCALLLVAVMFSPFLLPGRCLEGQGVLPPAAAGTLLAALCLPLLAYLHPMLAFAVTALVALCGLLRGLRLLAGFPLAGWVLAVLGAALAALHVFPVDGLSYVYAAETAPLGLLDNATYFQAAVSSIIAAHGVPSIGADGLQLLHYHFGSHFWFAAVGEAAHASPLYAYAFGQLAVLLPALYVAVLLAAGALARPNADRVAILAIGVALLAVFDTFISRVHLSSESFTFSLAAALAVLPLMLRMHEAPGRVPSGQWIVALCAIAVITTLKVSTGYVLVGILAYMAWRRFGFAAPAWGVGIVLALILACAKLFFSPRGFVIADPMILLSSYKQYIVADNFFTLLLPAAFVLAAWYGPQLRARAGAPAGQYELSLDRTPLRTRLRGLAQAPRTRTELWLVAITVAFLPVLLLPIGSNAVYFSEMPHWLLLPAAVAWLAGLAGERARAKWVVAALAALVLVTLPFLPVNVDFKGLRAFVGAVDDGAPGPKLMNEPQALKRFFAANLSHEKVLFGSEFVRKLQANPWQRFAADLRATVREKGQGFGVFVPPSNLAFWNKLEGTGPYWCADMHLFIPSQTGAVMVKGLQPAEQTCPMFGPGSPDYGPAAHTAAVDDAALCGHAAAAGVSSVLIVNSATEPARNRMISCNGSK
jgi:hypothetical protein